MDKPPPNYGAQGYSAPSSFRDAPPRTDLEPPTFRDAPPRAGLEPPVFRDGPTRSSYGMPAFRDGPSRSIYDTPVFRDGPTRPNQEAPTFRDAPPNTGIYLDLTGYDMTMADKLMSSKMLILKITPSVDYTGVYILHKMYFFPRLQNFKFPPPPPSFFSPSRG